MIHEEALRILDNRPHGPYEDDWDLFEAAEFLKEQNEELLKVLEQAYSAIQEFQVCIPFSKRKDFTWEKCLLQADAVKQEIERIYNETSIQKNKISR